MQTEVVILGVECKVIRVKPTFFLLESNDYFVNIWHTNPDDELAPVVAKILIVQIKKAAFI